MTVSVGICAYNEQKNIGVLLRNLLYEQRMPFNFEIIAVCSGCTDETPYIVKEFSFKDSRVNLIIERERRGKASAVNKIFRAYRGSYLFFIPADALPERGSLAKILRHFQDSRVGVVGGKPVLINQAKEVHGVEAMAHLMWRIHNLTMEVLNHDNVLTHASGEMFCIRRGTVTGIPDGIVNDDAYISMKAHRQGFLVRFEPQAQVRIKAPSTFPDLIRQRKRIVYGHYQIRKMLGNFPRTMESMAFYDPKRVIRILAGTIKTAPKETTKLGAAIIFEMLINLWAFTDILRGKSYILWERAETTKKLTP